MSRSWILVVLAGCGGYGGTLSVAEPGLREDDGAEERDPDERDPDERDPDEREADEERGVEACADLLRRCLDLGVSDDLSLRTFDACLTANVREGDEPARGDEERDGDGRGDDGGGDPER